MALSLQVSWSFWVITRNKAPLNVFGWEKVWLETKKDNGIGIADLFEEVEGFGSGFWTEDHLRKMIDEFEKVKQQLAECLGIPQYLITIPTSQVLKIMTTKLGDTKGIVHRLFSLGSK
ncbi:hypothetical protein ACE6H2_026123 [Prunus campanulata]